MSPLMISDEAPGPVMTSDPALLVAAIVGSAADPRVMMLGPLVNNEAAIIISSLAALALASVIASLKDVTPSLGLIVSAVVVTVIGMTIGVTAGDALEVVPVPTEFVATTENVYAVPLVRPVTEMGDDVPVAVTAVPPPTGVAVTV